MARPAMFGDPAIVTIRVRVTLEQQQAIQQVARENQTDVSGVIREAVNVFVADYKDDAVFRGTKPKKAA